MSEWRNRIVGEGEESPLELIKKVHPDNARIHPEGQATALEDVLDKVGFISRVIVNKSTGRLLDGHLRVELGVKRGEAAIPVEYVDLSPEEESLVLATYDPIAGLAEFDPEILKRLSESIKIDFDFDVRSVFREGEFDRLVDGSDENVEDIDFKEYDESVEDEVEYITCPHCGEKFPK